MLQDLLNKLENWKTLTLNARDACEKPVKYVEFTGQLNAIEATTALVKLFIDAERGKDAQGDSAEKPRKASKS